MAITTAALYTFICSVSFAVVYRPHNIYRTYIRMYATSNPTRMWLAARWLDGTFGNVPSIANAYTNQFCNATAEWASWLLVQCSR